MHPYPTWTKRFKHQRGRSRVWPSGVGGGALPSSALTLVEERWQQFPATPRCLSILLHFFTARPPAAQSTCCAFNIYTPCVAPRFFGKFGERHVANYDTNFISFSLPLPRTLLLKKLDAECVEFFPANGDAAKQKCCLAAESFRLIWCIMRSDGSTVSDVMLDMFHRGGYKQIGKQTNKQKKTS